VPEGKALFFRASEPQSVPSDGGDALDAFAALPTQAEKPRTRQSAVFLEERHIDWLEDRCREARKGGGRAIRKAAIIRALLDAAMESGIDLTGLRREEDLARRVRQALHK
jgi:hypothetical protein